MKISVVIPVLNEEQSIARTLSEIRCADNEEVIVVDGGSSDGTLEIAGKFTDKVFIAQKGRGCQMNFGARQASGDILFFLHADCVMPERGFEIMREVLADQSISAGAFDLGIDHPAACFRIIEFGANVRSHLTSIPYGDQGLFVKRKIYERIGGFSEMPLMEDIDIAKRLKRQGKIKFSGTPILASPRRWLKEGPLFTTFRDWILALSYTFWEISPDKLLKYYRDVR
jgi:rSAM/selenodomain-associated transferase 2